MFAHVLYQEHKQVPAWPVNGRRKPAQRSSMYACLQKSACVRAPVQLQQRHAQPWLMANTCPFRCNPCENCILAHCCHHASRTCPGGSPATLCMAAAACGSYCSSMHRSGWKPPGRTDWCRSWRNSRGGNCTFSGARLRRLWPMSQPANVYAARCC